MKTSLAVSRPGVVDIGHVTDKWSLWCLTLVISVITVRADTKCDQLLQVLEDYFKQFRPVLAAEKM